MARVRTYGVFLLACPMLMLRATGPVAPSESNDGESNDGYVGSQACSTCHQGIYQQYAKTSMGRSMSLVTASSLQNIPSGSHFNERLNRHFEAFSLDGKLYQSESGTGTDGQESFRDVHQLEWIIGAGVNGFGAITRKDGFLFQAPLSFYSRPHELGALSGIRVCRSRLQPADHRRLHFLPQRSTEAGDRNQWEVP